MTSELAFQSAVAGTATTATVANYVEGTMLNVISPDSLLDFQFIATAMGGVSIRDAIFLITAFMAVRAAMKVKGISVKKLRRRKTDKTGDKK